jgi:hypothetical protein
MLNNPAHREISLLKPQLVGGSPYEILLQLCLITCLGSYPYPFFLADL